MNANLMIHEKRNCTSPQHFFPQNSSSLKHAFSQLSLAKSHKAHKDNLIRRYNSIIGKLSSKNKSYLLRSSQPSQLGKECRSKTSTQRIKPKFEDPTGSTKDPCWEISSIENEMSRDCVLENEIEIELTEKKTSKHINSLWSPIDSKSKLQEFNKKRARIVSGIHEAMNDEKYSRGKKFSLQYDTLQSIKSPLRQNREGDRWNVDHYKSTNFRASPARLRKMLSYQTLKEPVFKSTVFSSDYCMSPRVTQR